MEIDFARIREQLRQLRDTAALSSVFGAETHRFITHPPLSEEIVQDFETQQKITLPPEYRGFLIHVGNGGAGPAYGLFKLGEMDSNWRHKRWKQNDGFVGKLTIPFPHTGPWNDRSEEPVYHATRENDPEWEDEYQRQVDAWEERVYWNSSQVNGEIPICHLGCAYRQWLVVAGSEAGNVWDDNRADYGGLKPVQQRGRGRVTFLEWYGDWLEEALGS